MGQNGPMADVEILAVGEVSRVVALCPRLKGEIASNDKTPFTDGFIHLYNSDKQNNASYRGRVPVQVKGRTHPGKVKQSATHLTYPVDKDTLTFFLQDGGALYFYVPFSPNGKPKGIFYRALTPFRLKRILARMKDGQKSLSVKLERLPTSSLEIQRRVEAALDARKQAGPKANVEEVLSQLKSIRLRTLNQLSDSRPTILNLDDTDFSVEVTTVGGSIIPIDIDLVVYPASYVPSEMPVAISCGSIIFPKPVRRQVDADNSVIILSKGLTIRIRREGQGFRMNLDIQPAGSLVDQANDLTFFVAAAQGNSVAFGDRTLPPLKANLENLSDLKHLENRFREMVTTLDHLGVPDELKRFIKLGAEDKQRLLMLHHSIVDSKEMRTTEKGVGRMDVDLGDFRIITLASDGKDKDHRIIIDPFDPAHRGTFSLLKHADGGYEELPWATVYESLQGDDFERTLNLHIESIADAYDAISERNIALTTANQLVLNLLLAADKAESPMRDYLLRGATNLSDWLVTKGGDDITYKINRWQIDARNESLTSDERKTIRRARRAVREQSSSESQLQDACLTILLQDFDELSLILESLPDADTAKLKSWPIWHLMIDDADSMAVRAQK